MRNLSIESIGSMPRGSVAIGMVSLSLVFLTLAMACKAPPPSSIPEEALRELEVSSEFAPGDKAKLVDGRFAFHDGTGTTNGGSHG